MKRDSQNGLLGKRGEKGGVSNETWKQMDELCLEMGTEVNTSMSREEFKNVIKGIKKRQ